MATRAFMTVEDHEGRVSTTSWWVQDVSSLNFDSVTQDIDEVKDAAADVIRGTIRRVGFTKVYGEDFTGAVADAEAQVEEKWLVKYRDTTQFLDAGNTIANPGWGKVFDLEIPTALLTGNLIANSEMADLTDAGDMDVLRDSIEANIRSPYNNNANAPTIEVISIEHVGRK